MSALTRFFAGAIHGRTHRSAPTQCRKRSGTNGKWSGTVPLRGGTKPAPYRCTTVGSSERADVDIGPSAAEAAWRSGGWLGPARRRGSGTPDRRALRGKVQECPFLVSGACAGKNRNHFSPRRVRGEKYFSGRKCGKWPPQWGGHFMRAVGLRFHSPKAALLPWARKSLAEMFLGTFQRFKISMNSSPVMVSFS